VLFSGWNESLAGLPIPFAAGLLGAVQANRDCESHRNLKNVTDRNAAVGSDHLSRGALPEKSIKDVRHLGHANPSTFFGLHTSGTAIWPKRNWKQVHEILTACLIIVDPRRADSFRV
jgi:hypothetical protein